MQVHELIQGSPEWHQHRATHFNASDAPAMMGCSPYTTRTQLLHRLKTGIAPEVDAGTQSRFNDGHRFEALARPLAEKIIGEELYPVTGSEGKLSASFDGLTMAEDVAFEHKTMNAELYGNGAPWGDDFVIPLHYRVQMEHQLLVSGAARVLFMASRWDSDGTMDVAQHCWYTSDAQLRSQIMAGWAQLEADVCVYVPVETPAPAVATPTLGLPAVSIRVDGSIALIDNLDVFGEALKAYIAGLVQKPETDQHFADLDSAVKTLKKAEEALDAAENGALAQTSSIDTMRKTVALYRDLARTNRLMAEKLVKTEKDNRKIAIITAGRTALGRHESGLQERTQHHLPPTQHNFEGVCKGPKTIASIQNAVDTELARCKIEANATADRIEANLKAIAEAGHGYLFADAGTLALKDPEYVAMAVKNRIADHQAKEAAKEEATRQRIRQEEIDRLAREQAEAERATRAKLADEQAKAERDRIAEEAAKVYRIATAPDVAQPSHQPTLKLGTIAERLGFNLTAAFISSLGFEPAAKMNNATLYHEDDFSRICTALVQHIESVCEVA